MKSAKHVAAEATTKRGQTMGSHSNRRRFWTFVRSCFGLELPDRIFTPDHSTPLDFLRDAFLHPGQDIAAWACRSGGKTLAASILAAMEFLSCDGLQARVLSGSRAQAGNLYEYWSRWCAGALADRVEGTVGRALTRLAGGRMEIVSASQRSVRGPKVHRLFEDELDEIPADVDAAAVGMIVSTPGRPGRTVYTSTWHRCDGPMARLVEAGDAGGVRLHRWNLWEAIERCPQHRHQDGRGCAHCPLAPACIAQGEQTARTLDAEIGYRPRNPGVVGVAAEGAGFLRIDDAVKAFRKLSRSAWEAEYECRRPRVEGLVYPEFDPSRHRCVSPPGDLTVYRSIDWGHGVFVCLWIGEDRHGCAYVLDTYRAELGTVSRHAEHLLAHPIQSARATYCDPAGRNRNDQTGRSNVDIFREHGIRCTYTLGKAAREVRNGIRLVRAALEPADGSPRLFYVPTDANRTFARAMQSYRNRRVNGVWIDEPQDPQEHEHIPDALRYFFVNRARSGAIGVVRLRTS
jgi:hypothetical protein